MGLTPNANPIVKKGILSTHSITNFENFNEDLKITDDEIIYYGQFSQFYPCPHFRRQLLLNQ